MTISDFVGLDPKMLQLMRSAQAGRIVHALLFSGPRGTGKKSMAAIFARSLLCQDESSNKPCDHCPACKRAIGGTHPDIHTISPDPKSIKVEAVRNLVDELSLAAYEGGKKIAIIEQADKMTEAAQNALLKTLENPSGDTLFILLSDTPSGLLSTIVSRCLLLRFHCLEINDTARLLQERGIPQERALLLSSLAQGSVGRALELDSDADYLTLRTSAINAIESLKNDADVALAASSLQKASKREEDILQMLEMWAHDLMRVQSGLSPLDATSISRLKSSRYDGNLLLRRVILARQQLKANVSWTNVLETMLFELAQRQN